MSRPATIHKTDLANAFQAAKAAGYDHVSIFVETADGKRFLISAGTGGDAASADMTPYDRWRASHATC